MLTDRIIQAALKSPKPELTLNDKAAGRGTGSLRLVVRRSPTALSANWFGCWKAEGKPRKMALGRYPDVPLAKARQEYQTRVRDVLAAGRDPRGVVVKREGATVEALFTGYVDSLRRQGAESANNVEAQLLKRKNNPADFFGRDRMASTVTPGDVSAFLRTVHDRGTKAMADHFRGYMSAAFNWAAHSTHDYTTGHNFDWGLQSNPVTMVPKDPTAKRKRSRNLSVDELRRLWLALDADKFTLETGAAIRLMICCGQRVRENLRIERHDLDLDASLWLMPAAKTKMKRRDHEVVLPPQAKPVLRQLMAVNRGSHLFTIESRTINAALVRWAKREGIERFQTRDLRRTWKSRAGDGAGIDKATRDLIQQHSNGDVSSTVYDHADYRPVKRKAMAAWARWMRRTFRG